MDVVFKGRHTSVPERFRQHAAAKLAKLEKLDHRAFRVDVEVSKEHNPRQYGRRERVELTITSRGPAIRAEAAADDRFAALDIALGKLESRLRRACDRRKARHAGHAASRPPAVPAGAAAAGAATQPRLPAAPPAGWLAPDSGAAGAAPASANGRPARPSRPDDGQADGVPPDDLVPIEMEGDGPLVVRQKFHAATPMTIDQALFEMELVGHDFYLFRDKQTGHSSVVYRRRGYQYGVIRLVEQPPGSKPGPLAAS